MLLPQLATWPGLIEALVAAARRHPGRVGFAHVPPLDTVVPGLLSCFCDTAAGRSAILSVGGAGDGGVAVGLLLETLGRADFARSSGADGRSCRNPTIQARLVLLLNGLTLLSDDSAVVRARMRLDAAAVAGAVGGLEAAVRAREFTREALCLINFVAACFEPSAAGEPTAASGTAASGPGAAAAAARQGGVLPLQAAIDALPSLVAAAVRLLGSTVDCAAFAVHTLVKLHACPMIKERAAGWQRSLVGVCWLKSSGCQLCSPPVCPGAP
jgi:hypothetical protein